MITLCKIDGRDFSSIAVAIEKNYTVVEGSNSGYAVYRHREIRDIKGVKIGHSITFSSDADPELFDELTAYLFETVRPYVVLDAINGQTPIQYEAAYNTGHCRVSHIDDEHDVVYWDDLTVDFRPMENQIDIED